MGESNNNYHNKKTRKKAAYPGSETNLERVRNELSKFYKNWLKKGKKTEEIVHFLDILAGDLKMEEKEVLKCLKELENQKLLKVIMMGNFSPIKLTPQGWKVLTGTEVSSNENNI